VQRWEEILKVNDGDAHDFMLFIPSGTLTILPKPAFRKNLKREERPSVSSISPVVALSSISFPVGSSAVT